MNNVVSLASRLPTKPGHVVRRNLSDLLAALVAYKDITPNPERHARLLAAFQRGLDLDSTNMTVALPADLDMLIDSLDDDTFVKACGQAAWLLAGTD